MPNVRSLLQPVLDHAAFRQTARQLAEGARETTLSGLTRTAKALAIAGFAHELNRPLIVLTGENEVADELRQAAQTFLNWLEGKPEPNAASVLPALDCTPYDGRSPHPEISERRAVALWNIARDRTRILFVPVAALLGRFRDRIYYSSLALELKQGDELSMDDLVEHLGGVGYEKGEPVSSVGQFSLRGGILDVFPPGAPWPAALGNPPVERTF